MASMKGMEWTFDTASSLYEKMRPGYVDGVYQTIFDYCPINSSSRVLEIGIGSGQATLPFLQTGCRYTAVEYGAQLSEQCREKFKDYPGFSVITGRFEDVEPERETYDLVVSATAFHWVPEEIGYPKVYSILKHGGTFARFANHPFRDKGNPALGEEIDALYRKYYDAFYHKERQPLQEYGEEQARQVAMTAQAYGFEEIRYALFSRTRTFRAEEYRMLLGTYSDHIAITEPIRTEFFARIEEAINRHGGEITIYDTIDLQLARKP